MSDKTPRLGLPYILAGQAQKEITHNEALNLIDAAVQLSVLDRDLAAPPPGPALGDRYLVAAGASGAWAGKSGQIALWTTAWQFLPPLEGWTCWVADEDLLLRHDGSAWVPFASSFGLELIGRADAAAARASLGLGSAATRDAPAGEVVGTTDAQTLTGKTLSDATLSGTTVLATGHAFSGQIANAGAMITASASGPVYRAQVNDGATYLSGGSAAAAGGNLVLYGGANTKPDRGVLRSGGQSVAEWSAGGLAIGGSSSGVVLSAQSTAAVQLRVERSGSGTAGIQMVDPSQNDHQILAGNTDFQLVAGGGVRMLIRGNGAPQMIGAYSTTTAAAANLTVDSSGSLKRSTSSERHKTGIEPIDPAWSERVVYGAEPIWYRSACPGDPPEWSWWGLSAEREAARDPRMVLWRATEEVEERHEDLEPVTETVLVERQRLEMGDGVAVLRTEQVPEARPVLDEVPVLDETGAPVLVEGEDGASVPLLHRVQRTGPVTKTRKVVHALERPVPEGVHYTAYVPHLIVIAQRQRDRIAALEARLAGLEAAD